MFQAVALLQAPVLQAVALLHATVRERVALEEPTVFLDDPRDVDAQ